MSDEMNSPNESRPPDELRLPDQLAACEARLAALPLAASRLNRDEVLYRAGWAAAEAKLSVINPSATLHDEDYRPAHGRLRVGRARLLPSRRGRGSIAAWSLTSAALAASLAVAATLAMVSGDAPRVAEEAGDLRPPLAAVANATGDEAQAPRQASASALRDERGELALAHVESMLRWNQAAPSASLLAAIRRRQTQRWDQPILVSTTARAAAESPAAPPTARALLDELLPAAPENSDASTNPRRPSPLGDDTI